MQPACAGGAAVQAAPRYALHRTEELSAVLPGVILCGTPERIAVVAFQAVIKGVHLIFAGLHVVAISSALLEASGTRVQDATAIAVADAGALRSRRASTGTARSPSASGVARIIAGSKSTTLSLARACWVYIAVTALSLLGACHGCCRLGATADIQVELHALRRAGGASGVCAEKITVGSADRLARTSRRTATGTTRSPRATICLSAAGDSQHRAKHNRKHNL